MNLFDIDMTPGVIIDVDDPKSLGRIKCVSPGVFDTSTMPKEILPWVYPFGMMGNQSFSMPEIGSKIWLLKNTEGVNEYWYIPMFEYTNTTRSLVSDGYKNGVDVLVSRTGGAKVSKLTYDDNNGFIMAIGDDSINITSAGHVNLKSGDTEIKMSGLYIEMGGGGNNYEFACLGDTLAIKLSKLQSAFYVCAGACALNPFVMPLSGGFLLAANAIGDTLDILSKNIKIT